MFCQEEAARAGTDLSLVIVINKLYFLVQGRKHDTAGRLEAVRGIIQRPALHTCAAAMATGREVDLATSALTRRQETTREPRDQTEAGQSVARKQNKRA